MIIEAVGDVDGGCNVDRGGGHKDGAAGDVKDDKGWSQVIKVMITSGLVELKPAQVSPAIAASIGCKGFCEEGMIRASLLPDSMILVIHIWITIEATEKHSAATY